MDKGAIQGAKKLMLELIKLCMKCVECNNFHGGSEGTWVCSNIAEQGLQQDSK